MGVPAGHVAHTGEQVAGVDRLPLVVQHAVAFRLTVATADQDARHVVVLVDVIAYGTLPLLLELR